MGQILNTGFGFFVLIIAASYTANLASCFISAKIVSAPMQSIDDADSRGLSVCVLAGTVAEAIVQSTYSKLNMVSVNSVDVAGMIQAMNQGQCQGAVMSQSDWDMAQVDATCNSQCNLISAGSSFRHITGVLRSVVWSYRCCFEKGIYVFIVTAFDLACR